MLPASGSIHTQENLYKAITIFMCPLISIALETPGMMLHILAYGKREFYYCV
jgi:hypothetical protein